MPCCCTLRLRRTHGPTWRGVQSDVARAVSGPRRGVRAWHEKTCFYSSGGGTEHEAATERDRRRRGSRGISTRCHASRRTGRGAGGHRRAGLAQRHDQLEQAGGVDHRHRQGRGVQYQRTCGARPVPGRRRCRASSQAVWGSPLTYPHVVVCVGGRHAVQMDQAGGLALRRHAAGPGDLVATHSRTPAASATTSISSHDPRHKRPGQDRR